MLNFYRSLRRYLLASLTIIVMVIAYTAYIAISNVVAEQSRLQQESISPLFSLITGELLKPLYTAQTIADTKIFHPIMDNQEIDAASMSVLLQKLENQFDMRFFAASERSYTQYFSDGKMVTLNKEQENWYFAANAVKENIIANLGNVNDMHLYFNIKIYNDLGEYLGIVGIGKKMEKFQHLFSLFKQQYGYEFIFVNEKNEIMLSSEPALPATEQNITHIEQWTWYQQAKVNQSSASLNSEIITIDEKDFLLSEIRLRVIKWRLLLLLPLDARQTELNSVFINNTITILLVFILAVLAVIFTLRHFRKSIESQMEIDYLSQLPNRAYVERKFKEYTAAGLPVSVVLLDVDHFKDINDNYGHNIGDRVITEISTVLKRSIRDQDVAGRWGGEEFILLLPHTSLKRAEEVAERARLTLSTSNLVIEGQHIHVTASFGVTTGNASNMLDDLVNKADTALYKAKDSGRNQVCKFEKE